MNHTIWHSHLVIDAPDAGRDDDDTVAGFMLASRQIRYNDFYSPHPWKKSRCKMADSHGFFTGVFQSQGREQQHPQDGFSGSQLDAKNTCALRS